MAVHVYSYLRLTDSGQRSQRLRVRSAYRGLEFAKNAAEPRIRVEVVITAIAGAAQDILSVFVPSLGYLVTVSGNVYSVVL